MSETPQRGQGSTSSAITNGAVRVFQDYTGRGPTKGRTTINGDTIMILFGDVLTKGERKLAENGDAGAVIQMRHRYQEAMREDLVAVVETHVGRKVVAFMSANHISPDLAAEIFVLEPLAEHEQAGTPQTGAAT
jgi:uncharacterized protein YbcI